MALVIARPRAAAALRAPRSERGGYVAMWSLQRVPEEGCCIHRSHPGIVHDQTQRVPDSMQPDPGEASLTGERGEPVGVHLRTDRPPLVVHDHEGGRPASEAEPLGCLVGLEPTEQGDRAGLGHFHGDGPTAGRAFGIVHGGPPVPEQDPTGSLYFCNLVCCSICRCRSFR